MLKKIISILAMIILSSSLSLADDQAEPQKLADFIKANSLNEQRYVFKSLSFQCENTSDFIKRFSESYGNGYREIKDKFVVARAIRKLEHYIGSIDAATFRSIAYPVRSPEVSGELTLCVYCERLDNGLDVTTVIYGFEKTGGLSKALVNKN